MLLGAGLALLSELTDSTIRRRDRLETLLEVPVISRLPCIPRGSGG
jgi:capsular polysaccharide biosynthesis protein